MKFNIYILVLLSIFSSILLSSNAFAESKYSEKDQYIYNKTREMCTGSFVERSAAEQEIFMKSMSNSGIINSAISLFKGDFKSIHNLSISSTLQEFFNSGAFEDAMNSCYTDQWEKNLFMIALISADISGKATSFLSDISLVRGLSWGFRAAFAVRGTQMPMYWYWFRKFFSKAMTTGGWVNTAGRITLWKFRFTPLALTPLRYFNTLFTANLLLEFRKGYLDAQEQEKLAAERTKQTAGLMEGFTSPIEQQISKYEDLNKKLEQDKLRAKSQDDRDFADYLISDNNERIKELRNRKNKIDEETKLQNIEAKKSWFRRKWESMTKK